LNLTNDQPAAAQSYSGNATRSAKIADVLLPSATDLVFVGLLVALMLGSSPTKLLGDGGTGWHIRTGEIILASHSVPHSDPFSSVMRGRPWFAWEWLYDALIAAIHARWGLNGVVLLTALLIAATFAFVLRRLTARGVCLPLAAFLVAIAIAASTLHMLARPHVVSWLLAAVFFDVLDANDTRAGGRNTRMLYWLPLLMIFWANLHAGFMTGFVLLGIYLVSSGLRSLAGDRGAPSRVRAFGAVSGACFLASLLNPYGFGLYGHILRYLSNPFLMAHIEEFQTPNFHNLAPRCFAVLLLLVMVSLAVAVRRISVAQMLTLLFATGSALYSARNIPVSSALMVLIAGPLLSDTITAAATSGRRRLSRWHDFAVRMTAMERRQRAHIWVIGAIVAVGILCSKRPEFFHSQFSPARFPVAATDEIVRFDFREPIFCPDFWGGYLVYRLYPRTRVVVDDRHDLYGEEFLRNYLTVTRAEPGWQGMLSAWKVNWVLMPEDAALTAGLEASNGWSIVYRDHISVLFRRVAN
jgi:hypothetical protein